MKRKILDVIFFVLTTAATLIIGLIITLLITFIFRNGVPILYQQLTQQQETEKFFSQQLGQMLISTLFLTITTLILVLPFAISAAIYLHVYALENRLAQMARFCIQLLASIPSIVYGLFGMLIFVQIADFGMSILSGATTLAVMLTPIIITQTENALRQVPKAYYFGAASLGATRFETLKTLILPTATPGIIVAVILAIGRILSESAALIFTIGTFVKLPLNQNTGVLSIFETGTTLTVRALIEFKEYGNLAGAAAIGVIVLFVIIVFNLINRVVMWVANGHLFSPF